jgi:hypothetical protein
VHRREDIHAAGGEDPSHLGDHSIRVRYEYQRVLMEDDVEFPRTESAQITHVRPQVFEMSPTAQCQTAHRRELGATDVDKRRRGPELGEEHRVPASTAGERKHPFSVEVDSLERVVRDAIEKSTLPGACSWRRPLRTRVRDPGLREPLPHALVVCADVVDGDPLCHGEIVAA